MFETKSLKLRDLCLLFGCPCVVFLSISLLVSLKVGADFQQDSLAKLTAFILCNLLLWLLYVMFQSVLLDLFPLIFPQEKRRCFPRCQHGKL